jgi:hypothetical protein
MFIAASPTPRPALGLIGGFYSIERTINIIRVIYYLNYMDVALWTALRSIAVTNVIFQPLFAWLGLLTFLSLITTASYGYLLIKGKVRSIPTHKRLAASTLTLGIIHAILALSTLI